MSLRILLITPIFYGIEIKIQEALAALGHEVTWIENKSLTFDYHGTHSKLKSLRRIYYLLFSPDKRYIKKKLGRIENDKFDILFSINGFIICPYLFRKLKKANPQLTSVLYLWDAFSMYTWTRELKLFNKVYTFDFDDAERYCIKYKPNFYIRNKVSSGFKCEYDLFFAGQFNPHRLFILDKIVTQVEQFSLKYFVILWPAYKILLHNNLIYKFLQKTHLRSDWVEHYIMNYEAIEGILKRDYLTSNCLSYDLIQFYMQSSNVVLDLPVTGQTGYTHRMIEALANGKKVLTTNLNIKKENFYISEQIQILDNQNPEINYNWVTEQKVFPVNIYFRDLELLPWLTSLLNVELA